MRKLILLIFSVFTLNVIYAQDDTLTVSSLEEGIQYLVQNPQKYIRINNNLQVCYSDQNTNLYLQDETMPMIAQAYLQQDYKNGDRIYGAVAYYINLDWQHALGLVTQPKPVSGDSVAPILTTNLNMPVHQFVRIENALLDFKSVRNDLVTELHVTLNDDNMVWVVSNTNPILSQLQNGNRITAEGFIHLTGPEEERSLTVTQLQKNNLSALEEVMDNNGEDAYYDVLGNRVSSDYKGIVIHNKQKKLIH